MKPAGNFTPPIRLDGQVSFGMSGNSARNRRPSEGAQRGVAGAAIFGLVAVNGAAMLTGFYHRSVLRCGRLAERKSGVGNILSAERRREKFCIGLSRIGYPRQPVPVNRNLYRLRKNLKRCHSVHGEPRRTACQESSLFLNSNRRKITRFAPIDKARCLFSKLCR
jgi:hypothetical protein